MSSEFKDAVKEVRKEKIPVRRMISNNWFMVKYAAKYDRRLIVSVVGLFCMLQVMKAVYDTILLKVVIDLLQGPKGLKPLLLVLLVSFVIVVSIEWINQLLEQWSKAKLVRLGGKIQRELMEKNGRMDLVCYDSPEYYDMYISVASKADEMLEKAVNCIKVLIGSLLALIVAAGVIVTIHPLVALFPVCGFLVNLVTRFKITRLEFEYDLINKKYMRKADYSKRVFYQPEYAKELKLTTVKEPLRKQFDEALDQCEEAAKYYGVRITWVSLLNWIMVYTVLSFFCVPAFLGYLALVIKSIVLGDVASTNNAANIVRQRLNETNFALVDFQIIGQYADRFRKLLNYETNIEGHTGTVNIPEERLELVLDDISFAYPGTKKNTLEHVSLTIHPGEKIAIVGENGAGKTTFVKLLMRLYDVTDGAIRYGDHDIRSYTTDEYRDLFGAVFQDYQIYGATVAENVLMGKFKDADEERVVHALTLADFGKRLATLPEGIHTVLTKEFEEKGVNLSGGEAQKVAIARMFAKEKKNAIAILDEPSSALDPVSEYKLNQNLIKNAEDATVIFISHRLSTTRMADRIYLFSEGKIKEQGTHEELMALNGEYAEMFERQGKNYIL
ncbi:MAG: ABC transporter ATP-binding protein [Eubacteriales bacterium]|nr:ABC transporter ATP-binding protein [Eubacteriales bacterium]